MEPIVALLKAHGQHIYSSYGDVTKDTVKKKQKKNKTKTGKVMTRQGFTSNWCELLLTVLMSLLDRT
jgi:hypothetical protein